MSNWFKIVTKVAKLNNIGNKTFDLLKFLVIATVCMQLSSCLSTKRISLFYTINESNNQIIPPKVDEQLVEQTSVLKITVNNIDQQSTITINTNNVDGTYFISDSGTIDFPFLGSIKVIGKTKNSIKLDLENLLVKKNLGISPIINVRISNFHITILGEVNKPGLFPIVDEQITITEALGVAGDLTPYGKRKNVLLIREINGNRTFNRLNLNDSSLFNPMYYNLKNRDVIYVEPNFAKSFNTAQTRAFLGFVTGLVTLVFLFSRF